MAFSESSLGALGPRPIHPSSPVSLSGDSPLLLSPKSLSPVVSGSSSNTPNNVAAIANKNTFFSVLGGIFGGVLKGVGSIASGAVIMAGALVATATFAAAQMAYMAAFAVSGAIATILSPFVGLYQAIHNSVLDTAATTLAPFVEVDQTSRIGVLEAMKNFIAKSANAGAEATQAVIVGAGALVIAIPLSITSGVEYAGSLGLENAGWKSPTSARTLAGALNDPPSSKAITVDMLDVTQETHSHTPPNSPTAAS